MLGQTNHHKSLIKFFFTCTFISCSLFVEAGIFNYLKELGVINPPLTSNIISFAAINGNLNPTLINEDFSTSTGTTESTVWTALKETVTSWMTSWFETETNQSVENRSLAMAPGDACTNITATQIAGTVWEDWNYDGAINETSTIGVKGMRVFIYDDCDAVVDSTETNIDGDYSFSSLSTSTTYRIEFVIPDSLSWAKPTQAGTDNGTSVQFVQPGNCASLGVASPSEYCETNPTLVTPCYVSGDPLVAGTASSMDVLVSFPYSASGEAGFGGSAVGHLAVGSEIGSNWGIAYQRKTQSIYTASFLRRHIGLGPLGLGGIYKVDLSSGTAVVSSFIDVGTLGVPIGSIGSNSARGLTGDATARTADATTVDEIAKIGLGNIDISADDNTLWFVNLANQTLYSMDISSGGTPTASDLTAYPIPNPGCLGGEWRPFALKTYRGDVYVGGVCNAQNSQDSTNLQATIYRFSNNTFSNIFTFSLDYNKGSLGNRCSAEMLDYWHPWSATITDNCDEYADAYPQPVLSDIEFDRDGSMIIGFFDRFGHQTGYRNFFPDGTLGTQGTLGENGVSSGEILRASFNGGTFILENNGTSGSTTTAGAGNGQGPGGGEYYFGDNDVLGFETHSERSLGGLVILPDSGQVVVTVYNATGNANTNGINWLSNTTGAREDAYSFVSSVNVTQQGKAGGLGDLALLCNAAPLEIGNYVWEDSDGDGIQDACESGISSVVVELYDASGTALIASTTTDANGQYYFSSLSNIGSGTWSGTGADTTLIANTTYTIRISNAIGGSQQSNLSGFSLTTTDANSNGSNNIDNDANIVSTTNAEITATTGDYGCVDHSFNFGFSVPCEINITTTQTSCTDNGGNSFTANYDTAITWSGEPSGENVNINLNGASVGTIDPSTQTSPQTVSFSVAADGTDRDTITATFATTTTCADTTSFKSPSPCPTDLGSTAGAICTNAAGEIAGTVWEDWNYDGAMTETTIIGVQGIQVNLYDDCGSATATTYTDSNGNYQFTGLTAGTTYRVEFSLPESVSCWAKPTQAGTDNGTTVQFVQPGNCASLGVANSADYCEENPKVFIPCYINGDGSGGQDVLISLQYQDQLPFSDLATNVDNSTAKVVIAGSDEIGAVWGLAYQRTSNTLFASAHFRGHTAIGPEGMDAIYLLNPITNNVTGHFNLSDFGAYSGSVTDPRPYSLPADPYAYFSDPLAMSLGGKTSLGDIELSADGNTLYVVNLHDKTLIRFDVSNPSAPSLIGSPIPVPTDGCTATPPSYQVNMGRLTANTPNSTVAGWEDGLNSAYTNKSLQYISAQWGGFYSIDVIGGFTNNTDVPASEEAVLRRMHYDGNGINLRFPVMPNQSYTVDLYIMSTGANTFNIDIEGNTLVSHTTAADVAEQETFIITPTDGILNIDLNPTSGVAVVNGIKITPINTNATTDETSVRPFALSQNEGKIYLGTVCSGELGQNTNDLMANVYELNENSASFTSTFSTALDYNRGETHQYDEAPLDSEYIKGDWKSWQDSFFYNPPNTNMHFSSSSFTVNYYPQPLLGDIDFTADGSMVLSFLDRLGLQRGIGPLPDPDGQTLYPLIAGDLMRVCKVNGTYVLEGEVGCTQNFAASESPTVRGPGAAGGEFYNDNGPDDYRETNVGGLVISKVHNQLMHTGLWHSATGLSGSGGSFRLMWLGVETGIQESHVEIFDGSFNNAKGGALGDLELLCSPAPLEIGNYVWEDTDSDGIQDACESGIQGVTVELYDAAGTGLIASTTTDANGQYYFSSLSNIGSGTWSGTGADTALIANTTYTIRISNAEGGSQQSNLSGFSLTTTDANGNASNQIDNDASIANITNADITATTGDYGCVDHSFDFGFNTSCLTIDSLLADRVICTGDAVDTLAVTTTITNPDSIAFVYFTSMQPDATTIYTAGTGIDTVQIAAANDTVRLTNVPVAAFSNTGSTPITFYVYAIAHPTPSEVACYEYDEIQVVVNPSSTGTESYAGCAGDGYSVTVNSVLYNEANASGTETITGGNVYGCDSTVTISLTFNALPTATTAAATNVTCTGTTPNADGTITLSGFTTGDTYDYTTGSTYSGTATYSSGSTTIPVGGIIVNTLTNPSVSQDYTVRIFNSNDCYVDRTVTLTETDCSCTAPTIAALTNETICEGGSFTPANVMTNVTNSVAVTYQWYDNNGTGNSGTTMIGSQTTAELTALPTAVGSYSYKVVATSIAEPTCTAEQTVDLVINATSTGTESYTGCSGDGYSVSVNGVLYDEANPTGTETLTNAVSCDSTVTISLTFNALPTATTAAATDVTCTGTTPNADGTITLSGFTTGDTYDYTTGSTYSGSATYSSGSTTIPVGGIIVNTLANPTVSQDYTVRIFNSNNCYVDRTVTLTENTCIIYDWGDLPDLTSSTNTNDYQTTSANNGPSHEIITGLSLGTTIDDETDGQATTNADGDGTDDDGIIFPSTMQISPGGTLNIPFSATNTTGSTAYVEMWIDWNGDGDFDDTNEMVTDIDDASGFLRYLPVSIPTTVTQNQLLGLRLRLSNTDNMTPYGAVASGEVEDYLLEVSCGVVRCLRIETTVNSGTN